MVNAVGTKRKDRKYNVLTANILNLPQQTRNSMDNTVLVGIYEVKKAKEFGGVCRMLTGARQMESKLHVCSSRAHARVCWQVWIRTQASKVIL